MDYPMLLTQPSSLEDHIIKTYGVLRRGLGFLAIALPIVLAVGGFIKYGLMLQDSISAYNPHSAGQ